MRHDSRAQMAALGLDGERVELHWGKVGSSRNNCTQMQGFRKSGLDAHLLVMVTNEAKDLQEGQSPDAGERGGGVAANGCKRNMLQQSLNLEAWLS